jgi:hypothetical protein
LKITFNFGKFLFIIFSLLPVKITL